MAYTKYPHPDAVRVGAGGSLVRTWLHRDHLQSIRLRTDLAGTLIQNGVYMPYGEPITPLQPPLSIPKGYIGERYDADIGLQFLNGRYYDPFSTRFISADWWDPTLPGWGRTDMPMRRMTQSIREIRTGTRSPTNGIPLKDCGMPKGVGTTRAQGPLGAAIRRGKRNGKTSKASSRSPSSR